jgi:hypothetical protein
MATVTKRANGRQSVEEKDIKPYQKLFEPKVMQNAGLGKLKMKWIKVYSNLQQKQKTQK